MASGTVPDRSQERWRMVEWQLVDRGIVDERVLAAFRDVPREAFISADMAGAAYADGPLPIGYGQTISQPYVVAVMIQALDVRPGDRALEVGAGSGYAAAILSRLVARLVTIERHAGLAESARERLAALGSANVEVIHADGTHGWPPAAPFDVILVSAGGEHVPPALTDQLAVGGRLVIPVGQDREQELLRLVKRESGQIDQQRLGRVSFVPLVESPDVERYSAGRGAP